MATQANQPSPTVISCRITASARFYPVGGFSIVYLAEDENEVPVAIKEYMPASLALRHQGDVLPAITEETWPRSLRMKCFFEEGKSLAGLMHSNAWCAWLNFFRATRRFIW